MTLRGLLDWFAGGPDGYMTLVHCMNHDAFWITLTVALDLTVAAGYVVIALHWRRNERALRDSPAKSALGTMKTIFVFCGICGYVFIPVKMFWPAWRLYDGFLVVLAYFTWRYALRSRELRVVYNELGRTEQLVHDLETLREEGRRKSFFLNALSHDLKTPLNGLLLQAELATMNAEANEPAALAESLEQIKTCARITAELLNSFLELGRLDWSTESLRVDTIAARDLLAELAVPWRARAEAKGLILTVEAPAGLLVRSDRLKLERILEYLLDNALKFTREGGVRVVAGSISGGVVLSVTDTGEGVAFEDQARIFDDFVQVQNRERDSKKGFGLGLAIARRLAHHLGGHLTLESAPGGGSRFTVFIPQAPPGDGRPESPAGRGGRRVEAPGAPASASG